MTKNRSMRIAVLVLALALITCCFVGTTFAKYTSTASGTSATTVAKWAIEAGKSEEEVSITGTAPTLTFDLFTTVLDTKDSAAETDVKTGKIAPGTKGAFTLSILNKSEVNAEYAIDYTVTIPSLVINEVDTKLPIQFKVGTGEWTNDIADVAKTAIAMESGAATQVIEWQWVFSGNDAVDTAFGVAAAAGELQVSVKADLTVDQVD